MIYAVVFTPEAEEQLVALYHYIAEAASPEIAHRYTSAIVTYCEDLRISPQRVHAAMTYAPVCASPTTKAGPSSPLRWTPSRSPSLACSTAAGITRHFWNSIRTGKRASRR